MKKVLQYVLLASLAMVFVVGCGDGKKKDSAPSISLSNPDSLIGTYNIDTFWVDAVITQLTNNCDEAKTVISAQDAAKGCGGDGNVTATAKATIAKDVNGNYVFTSKMQMAGPVFDNATVINNAQFGGVDIKAQQYNYTLYSTIPASEITSPIANIGASKAEGTVGRDALNISADSGATYKFEVTPDGRLLNTLTKSIPLPVNVYVLLKKTSDSVEVLEQNVKFPTPAIPKWNDTAVQPTPSTP